MAVAIRNLKIRHQILLVTLPPLFALLSAFGLFGAAYWMSRQTDRALHNAQESIVRGEALLRHVTEMNMGVRGYLLLRQRAQLGLFEAASPEILLELAALRQLESDEASQAGEVEAIRAEINRWQLEWANPMIEKVARGEEVDVPSALLAGEKRMAVLRRQILNLIESGRSESLARMREADQVMNRMLRLALGVGVLIAGVLVLLAREVTRLIAQPVQQLIEASERVSRGDYQPSLPPAAENEFGVLAQSFTRMTNALLQQKEEFAALNRFSEAVTQCTTEREIHDHILHSLRERFQPRQVMIFRLSTAENFLEAVATLVPLPESQRTWPVIEEPHNCRAVRAGRNFRVNDVAVEPLCPSKFVHPSEGSYYCGPLIAGGIIIGAVRLEGPKDYWTPERESLLESYLSGAATALSNLRLLDTMKQQANIDELTDLYNRRFLEEYARKQIAIARRKGAPFGLIMMDLDHFKSFNDTYGHEVGDRVLRHFAKTITHAMRETNLAARFGGEEFVVLLPDTGSKECVLVAEHIRHAVERTVVPSGTEKPFPQLTVSLGIAVYPEHGQTLEELLQASDKALYESKRAGRNRFTLYVEQAEPAG